MLTGCPTPEWFWRLLRVLYGFSSSDNTSPLPLVWPSCSLLSWFGCKSPFCKFFGARGLSGVFPARLLLVCFLRGWWLIFIADCFANYPGDWCTQQLMRLDVLEGVSWEDYWGSKMTLSVGSKCHESGGKKKSRSIPFLCFLVLLEVNVCALLPFDTKMHIWTLWNYEPNEMFPPTSGILA